LRVSTATCPGDPAIPSEDRVIATEDLIVVLDGQTARTTTGCRHGVSWYAENLGAAITARAADPALGLGAVLAGAIERTAARHPECDLSHPATPSATVAIVRSGPGAVEYLILGDTTVLVETTGELRVLTDGRIEAAAEAERRAADRHPIGSPEKRAALLRMKHAELAQRNRHGGFWVAAADPAAARHAVTGEIPGVRRLAVLSDGAARIVSPLAELTWPETLDLLESHGPAELIRRVRAAEATDPAGARWPRNKSSDDATAVYSGP
jgi:Protein phosphatase 2C